MKIGFALLFALKSIIVIGQHQDKVDFIRAEVAVEPKAAEKSINGTVIYTFKVLQDVDSVFLDAHKMQFSSVRLNGKRIAYSNSGSRISVSKNFKKDKKYRLELSYTCRPKQTVYFLGWNDVVGRTEDKLVGEEQSTGAVGQAIPNGRQIWTQGQGKYTSHWLPSFDAMEEKVEFDLTITFDGSYEVIANGTLESVKKHGEKLKTWHFDMEHPMSSYLLAFAIGDYDTQELISNSGIPIANYYYPKDSLKVEPTFRHTKLIFDFLEDEIGVAYPWQNYKQVPVHDFLYAGMENTGTTIFSDAFVTDSTALTDKNYVNVNAHELAHQWFGNLVTEKDANHHWLHEGFATYYAYLAEKRIFGDDHFYWKLYESMGQLSDSAINGGGESLLNAKASSLTFYEKGAWALFMLRERIGDNAFQKGMKTYLEKYRFKNVTVSNFLEEMEHASDSDLSDFKKDWLVNTEFPVEQAKKSLSRRSASLRSAFDLEADFEVQGDTTEYVRYWNSGPSIHLKKHILKKYENAVPQEIWEKAFKADTLSVRQTLASSTDITKFSKEAYESLLEDESYGTVEIALFKLWETYSQDRKRYLDRTANIMGLPNKNVRLLWLTLAMLTPEYEGSLTKVHFDELNGYTNPMYPFEVRQTAFYYLNGAFGLTDYSLKNLIKATNHHSWQFRKFARSLLKDILKDPDYKTRLENVSKELNEEELRYFNSIE